MSFGKFGKDDKEIPNTTLSQLTANQPGSSKYEAVLGKGSKVVGNLIFSGPVEIGGYVEGEITAHDKIVITESAEIKARIVGGEVIIHGTVSGDIHASKKLSLRKPAKVYGNLSSSNLSIEEGVIFEGKCSMASSETSEAGKFGSQAKVIPAAKVAGSI